MTSGFETGLAKLDSPKRTTAELLWGVAQIFQYNSIVARGWESKSVEEQQAETSEFFGHPKPRLTSDQKANQQMREGLLMSRNRIVQQLTTVQNSRHRKMLESALADLDARISQLG